MRVSQPSLELLERNSNSSLTKEDDLLVCELQEIGRHYNLLLDTVPKIIDSMDLYEIIYDHPLCVRININKEDGELLSVIKNNGNVSLDERRCFPAEIEPELLLDYKEELLYLWDQEKQEEIPLNILFRESILEEDEFVLQKNDTILRIPEYDFMDEDGISWKVLLLFHEKDNMMIYPCLLSSEVGELKVIQSPLNIVDYKDFSMKQGDLLYSTSETMIYPKNKVWHHIPYSHELFQK